MFLVPGGTALRDVLQAVNGFAYTCFLTTTNSPVTSHQEFQEMAKLQVPAEISEEDAVLAQSLENEFVIQLSALRYQVLSTQ